MVMLTGVQPPTAVSARQQQAARVRLTLLVGWAVTLAAFVALGVHPGKLAQLEQAVASGDVQSVTVTSGVQGSGFAVQEVTWRTWGLRRSAEALQATAGQEVPDATRSGVQRVGETELGASLRLLDPQLQVVRAPVRTASVTVIGSRVPGWVALSYIVLLLSTWVLVVSGPRPWRATRWAWFWILLVPAVGPVAVVLLSGPVAGMGWLPAPRRGRRRLTGGWAALGAWLTCFLLT